ncbi:MAG: 16S rRNA processing protein RimM [Bacteroidetes bacterium]|nr:MAG: 16S rRNA processing protein RimM [Bacteroidota bacterium]
MGKKGNSLREIGRLGKPHGVHGEINMIPVSPDLDRLLGLASIYVGPDEESAVPMTIVSSRVHLAKKGQTLLLRLNGVSDREAVGFERGNRVFASDEDLPDLRDQEYYYSDIVGFQAVSETGEALGKVTDVLDRPPQDLLVINALNGQEVFIPLVNEFVLVVDQEKKQVVLSLIEGMIQESRL